MKQCICLCTKCKKNDNEGMLNCYCKVSIWFRFNKKYKKNLSDRMSGGGIFLKDVDTRYEEPLTKFRIKQRLGSLFILYYSYSSNVIPFKQFTKISTL